MTSSAKTSSDVNEKVSKNGVLVTIKSHKMDNQSRGQAVDERSHRRTEFLYTSFALYLCFIAYGMAYNIWGPTWVDLVSLLDSTQGDMAYGNSLMAIGYIFGAFSGGLIFDYLNRQLLVAFYLILMAVSTSLTPVLKSYKLFLIFSVVFGLGEGGFDTACNAWVLEMWSNENGPYMQALYFMFGLGSLLAPLISLNYLDDITDVSNMSNNGTQLAAHRVHHHSRRHHRRRSLRNMTLNTPQFGAHHHNFIWFAPSDTSANGLTNTSANGSNDTTGGTSSHIYIPYCITGALLTACALIIVIMYIINKYEPVLDSANDFEADDNRTIKPSVSRTHCTDADTADLLNNSCDEDCNDGGAGSDRRRSKGYIVLMVAMGSLMFCFYEGMENINFEYLTTFNDNTKLNLSEETSDLVVSAMSIAYTAGRGVGILLAIKVQPKYFLYCNLVLISVANVVLYFFANTSETMLIVGTVILGLGFSTVFPCIYSYMEQHIHLTNTICGILALSCASIATVDPIIVGRYIKSSPYILLYVNIGSTVLVIISFICIEVISLVKMQSKSTLRRRHLDRPSVIDIRN